MPSPHYEIVNVVLTARLSLAGIDIDEIAASFGGSIIKRPLSVVVKYRGVNLAFHPRGTVIVTGARSEREAKTALRNFIAELTRSGVMDSMLSVKRTKVSNLVASADLGRTVDLDSFAQSIEGCAYDPCRSAALLFRTPGSSAVCQVHGSGRVTVLGAKSEEEIASLLERLAAALDEHDSQRDTDLREGREVGDRKAKAGKGS